MSAIDDFVVESKARDALNARMVGEAFEAFQREGGAAFDAPRELAVAHEIGHVIVAWVDGVTLDYSEVFPVNSIDEVGFAVAQQMKAKGMPLSGWSGFTHWCASPYPSDLSGKHDITQVDLPTFHHHVRMTVAGLAGERVLYGKPVPGASSLDELALAQSMCLGRARGQHFIAKKVWEDRWTETIKIINQHKDTGRRLMALFDNKDRIETDEIYSVLSRCHGGPIEG